MKQIIKPTILTFLILSACGATTVTASEPLFLTKSKKALLFTADGLGGATLRGKNSGQEVTIKCEKSSGHGFVLDKSPLVHEVHIEFSGKCEQEVLGNKGTCTEPIRLKLAYGELGLLNGHVLLLLAPEAGEEFVELKCINGNTKILGAVIGEFKLLGADGGKQYNALRKNFLLLYRAKGTTQEPEEIELLGKLMTGVSLKVEGFLGEKASEKASSLILVDGNGTIDP